MERYSVKLLDGASHLIVWDEDSNETIYEKGKRIVLGDEI